VANRKIAIAIDNSLMEQADEAARDLGLSRSGLIAQAFQDLLGKRRQSRISEQLNKAYANKPSPADRRLVRRLRTKLPVQDGW
jgi:metal-responsive CopG/Arc/MetJ family transcriptional regulator